MESVENKIIYLRVCEHGNVNAGRHHAGKCSLVRAKSASWTDVFRRRSAFWKDLLLPTFPVEAKEFRWLGCDVLAYVIYEDAQAGIPGRERHTVQVKDRVTHHEAKWGPGSSVQLKRHS